ncbi:MAG: TonB-dependent receptor plug domain-containing protein [Bacteroidota bacterium]
MKRSSHINFKSSLFFIAFFSLFSFLYLNNDPYQLIAAGLEEYTTNHAPEKIYVQTDKPYYTSADTIWFKTYLVNAVSHLPLTKSQVAYVDLIAPDSTLVDSKQLVLNGGSANGVFAIPEEAKGNYLLRAYTNYMRNQGEDFFFEQELPVFYQTIEEKGTANLENLNLEVIKDLQERPNVRFFPEGGDLVQGLRSNLGVKTMASNGYGMPMEGKIVNKAGQTQVTFKTYKFGLGSFPFMPQAGEAYEAVVKVGETEYVYEFPKVQEGGYVLSIKQSRVGINVRVNASEGYSLADTYVTGHLRGRIFCSIKGEEGLTSISADIPQKQLLDGVATFTLFSKDGEPLCERLIFVESPADDLKVNISTDQERYQKRAKVEVSIALEDLSGVNDSLANLSLAVTDLDAVKYDPNAENIKTWLLLNSDLRGEIESPNYFFTEGNKNVKAYLLDALMLTHGWRRFTWKSILEKDFRTDYKAEEGIFFEGQVKRDYSSNKPLNANVFLSALQVGILMDEQQTDAEGTFRFGPYQIGDTTDIVIQARMPVKEKAKKRKQKKGQQLSELDGNRYLSIEMAEKVERPPLKVARKQGAFTEEMEANLQQFLLTSREQKRADRQYDIRMIDLQGVEVKARRIEKNVYDKAIEGIALYSEPSNRLILDSIPGANSFLSVFDLLRRVPGVQVGGVFPNQTAIIRGLSSITLSNTPTYIVDGLVLDEAAIQTFPVADVYFIDVLKGAAASIYGARGGNGVIILYTRRGSGQPEAIRRKPGIINFKYYGMYKAREFYAPDYATKQDIHIKPDYRTTLFWEPNIITKNGKAVVSFYTADNASTYNIRLEGISARGVPVFAEQAFEVVE